MSYLTIVFYKHSDHTNLILKFMVEFDGEIIFETVNTWHSYRQNCVDGVNQMNINGWLRTDLERWLMPYFYVARCLL